jgi:hypothetical protein
MDKENVKNGIKEKGPAFLLGTIVGAAIVTAINNREKIVEVVENALNGKSRRGQNDERIEGH